MIVLCFLLALFGWTKAALSRTSPKPPHVVYLTNAYKAGHYAEISYKQR